MTLMTANLGDVLVRLNLHGMASNRARVAIGQVGGGPADDSAPNPAPGNAARRADAFDVWRSSRRSTTIRRLRPIRISEGSSEQSSWGGRGDDSDFNHLRAVGISGIHKRTAQHAATVRRFVDRSKIQLCLQTIRLQRRIRSSIRPVRRHLPAMRIALATFTRCIRCRSSSC